MYSRSQDFADAIKANGRKIYTKCLFNGTDTLYGDGTDGAVVSITLDEVMDSGEMTWGGTPSSSCQITIRQPSAPIAFANGTFQPYAGLMINGDVEWIPLGKFYVTDVKSNNAATVTITGYDGMYLLAGEYKPAITFPATPSAIMADIKTQTGITFTMPQVPQMFLRTTYECTFRQMVGWIFGLYGYTARFDRNGVLQFCRYNQDGGLVITGEEEYLNGVQTTTTGSFVIQSMTSGTEDNVLVTGSGVGISSMNPYMTQSRLDTISGGFIGKSFLPLTCNWRGDPCIEVGDIASIEVDNVMQTVFIMSHTLTISGGMKDLIRCDAPTDAEIRFDTTPTQSKINQVYTQLQEALASATALINGAQGGIFEVTDSNGDGVNDGWIIKASADPNFAGEVIVANYKGIGFSTDGGANYNVAITTDGYINGQFIRAGSVSADAIAVGDQTLGDYVYIGHRRAWDDYSDPSNPVVMRVGSLTAGRVQEIRSDRTSIFDASVYNAYVQNGSTLDLDDLDGEALFYYNETSLVMQQMTSIQFGTAAGSMLIQPLADGYGFSAV